VAASLARGAQLRDFLRREVDPGSWQLRALGIGGGDESKVIARRADGRLYFVKVGGMTQPAVARVVGQLGLAPPLVAGGTLADGRAVIVQPFVPGATADASWLRGHQDQMADVLRTLVGSSRLRDVLSVVGEGGLRDRARTRHRILEGWYGDIAGGGWPGVAPARAALDRLKAIAETLPPDGAVPVAVHADPQPANWRVGDNGRLYLTDWETARLDDPVTDVARVAVWCLPFAERAAFVDACGFSSADPVLHQVGWWQTTQYFAGIALWVVKRGRAPRGDYFLDLTEQLLAEGLWRV
jgi:hypothetical protein